MTEKQEKERVKALPSRILTYGCKTPRQGLELMMGSISRQHRYRNALCEAEHDRRRQVQQTLLRLCPEVQRLEDAVAEADRQLAERRAEEKARNARARRRQQGEPERATIRELRDALRSLRIQLRQEKQQSYVRIRPALDEIDAKHNERLKHLRAESGLYWGCYLSVEEAARSFRQGAPPRFARWQGGEGRISVQIQGGLTAEDAILCTDNRLRIELTRTKKHGRDQQKVTSVGNVWLRVGSEGRNPVWLVAPFTYHRPIPADVKIKWVHLYRVRQGPHWRYEVQFVVSRGRGFPLEDAADTGTVAVNLGWCSTPEGLQVARWLGDDGREGTLVLPQERIEYGWHKCDEIQSLRDQEFNAAIAELRQWLADYTGELPEWLAEVRPHLHSWKSQARLAALVQRWSQHRFAGDAEIYQRLLGGRVVRDDGRPTQTWWYSQDRHLWEWQEGLRARRSRWRKHLYRNFVASLRRQYHTVLIDGTNYKQLQQHQPVEEATAENATARYNQRVASPSVLAQCLREGFAECVRMDPEHITQRCAECGRLDGFDAQAERVRECRHCGHEEDQDRRACRNMMAAHGRAASAAVVS